MNETCELEIQDSKKVLTAIATVGVSDAEKEAMKIHSMIGNDAWTREECDPANGAKGYDAGVARKIFLNNPGVYVVIVSGTAPTHRGLKYTGKSSVVYYRKSSGGKWGRSVQKRFVTAS